MGFFVVVKDDQEATQDISSSVPNPPGKAMNASAEWYITVNRSGTLQTCNSFPKVGPQNFLKCLGTIPRT